MASKQKILLAVRQTLKDLVHITEEIEDDIKIKMENAIDSFIEENVSTYTKSEINEKFSSGKKTISHLREYIIMKSKEEGGLAQTRW